MSNRSILGCIFLALTTGASSAMAGRVLTFFNNKPLCTPMGVGNRVIRTIASISN